MEKNTITEDRKTELKELIEEARFNLNSDNNKTLECARKALDLAIELEEPKATVESYTLVGQGQMLEGGHTAAEITISSAHKLAQKHNLGFEEKTLRIYNAVLHQFKGEYDIAKELLLKELDGADHRFIPTIYNNLGIISGDKGEFEDGLKWFSKAKEIRAKKGRMDYAAGLMTNQSEMLLKLGRIQEAREVLFQALDVMESPEFETSLGKMFVFRDLGLINFAEGEFDQAIENLKLALTICEEHSFTQYYPGILAQTAKAYERLGDRNEVEKLYKKALNTENRDEQYEVLKELIDFNRKEGRIEEAFDYQSRLLKLSEEISKRNKMSALDALRTRFEVEEKQKEIERLRYENEVNKKLLEHSEQIKNQNDELKQFSYAISHDLRAPLRSIKGFAQLLNETNKSLSEEDKKDYLRHIISGVGRLDALIRDLYAFTALNKPLEQVKTDLNECLENAKKNLASLIRETATQIQSDELPAIIGVPSHIEQVFQNILQNSIKYRKEEEAPKLEVRFEKLPNHYRIMFKDNGRGIDSNFQDKAFQLFSRFQSEDAPGTGLGLAICQKVIQQMKGKIWLESIPGDGTMVTIELPA